MKNNSMFKLIYWGRFLLPYWAKYTPRVGDYIIKLKSGEYQIRRYKSNSREVVGKIVEISSKGILIQLMLF